MTAAPAELTWHRAAVHVAPARYGWVRAAVTVTGPPSLTWDRAAVLVTGAFNPELHPRIPGGHGGGEFTRTGGGGRLLKLRPGRFEPGDLHDGKEVADTRYTQGQVEVSYKDGSKALLRTSRQVSVRPPGAPAPRPRGPQWVAKGPGIYETADGRYRVENPYRQERRKPVWHLLESDGRGGWTWWNTYPRKADAQTALADHLAGQAETPGLTGKDLAGQIRRELGGAGELGGLKDEQTRSWLTSAAHALDQGDTDAAIGSLHGAGQAAADAGSPSLAEHYHYLARTLAAQQLPTGSVGNAIAEAVSNAPDVTTRGWLTFAHQQLAAGNTGQAEKYLRQAAHDVGQPVLAEHYLYLARTLGAGNLPTGPGPGDPAHDFAAKAAQVVPGLFGADTREAWNGQITTYQAKTSKSGGGVLAEIDWHGTMGLKESVAASLAELAAGGRVRDPGAPFIVLHELVHGAIPSGESWYDHKDAYQDRAVAHAEEGFTELGSILHAPEFFDQVGIGGRETDVLAIRDGHTVDNPQWEKRQQALAKELMATSHQLRRTPANRAAAQRLYNAAFAVQEGRAPYLDEAIHQLTTLGDPDATAAARRLQKLADAWALTDMSAKATLSEYAARLQNGALIRKGEAWGHYARKTAAAWAWSQELARLDGHSKLLDKPGSPGWTAAREIADEVNRQGPDGKFDTMTGQVIARWVKGGYLRPAARREVRRALIEGWTAGPVDALYAAGTIAIRAEEAARRDTATREAVNAAAPSGPPPKITLPPEAVTGPGKKALAIADWAWASPRARAAAAVAKLDDLATPDLSAGELREVQDTALMVSRLAGAVAGPDTRAAGTVFDESLHPRGPHGKFTTAGLGRELYRLAATEPDKTHKARLARAARTYAEHDLPGAAGWLRAIAERHPDPGPLTDLADRIDAHHAQSRQVAAPDPATDSARRAASSLDKAASTGSGADSIPGQDVASVPKHKGGRKVNYFGNTANTRVVTFPDGSKWVRKRDYPEQEMDAEVAYSRISDVFGAGAPPVIKRRYGDGEWETWQPFVPRAETAIEWTAGADPSMDPADKFPSGRDPETMYATPKGRRIGLVDKVTGGKDRHMGNWMVQDGGVPVPIDSPAGFSRADVFPAGFSASPFALALTDHVEWAGSGLGDLADQHPAAQWDQWQAGLEALQPEFDGLGMNEELANVIANYAGLRDQAGR